LPLAVLAPGATPNPGSRTADGCSLSRVTTSSIDFIDFLPTLAEITGAALPAGVTLN
jgi:hypothetical protein